MIRTTDADDVTDMLDSGTPDGQTLLTLSDLLYLKEKEQ